MRTNKDHTHGEMAYRRIPTESWRQYNNWHWRLKGSENNIMMESPVDIKLRLWKEREKHQLHMITGSVFSIWTKPETNRRSKHIVQPNIRQETQWRHSTRKTITINYHGVQPSQKYQATQNRFVKRAVAFVFEITHFVTMLTALKLQCASWIWKYFAYI